MSREHTIAWQLEQQRRVELENQRYRESANATMQKAIAVKEVLEKDFDSYFSEIKQSTENFVTIINSNLEKKPAYSRDEAVRLLSRLNKFKTIATEKERLRKNKEAQTSMFESFVKTITDEVEKSFANEELLVLEKEISSGKFENENNTDSVQNRLDEIKQSATKKADEWKKEQERLAKVKELKERIATYTESISKESIAKNDKENLLSRLEKMKCKIANTKDGFESFEDELDAIYAQIDEYSIKESARRECLKGIFKILQSQEFTVTKPKVQDDGTVLITASKPSGKNAKVVVDIDGKMNYRFDHYEGMTCLKDIEKFNVDLNEIYGVKLSDEKIIWENPDRISHQMNSTSDTLRRTL